MALFPKSNESRLAPVLTKRLIRIIVVVACGFFFAFFLLGNRTPSTSQDTQLPQQVYPETEDYNVQSSMTEFYPISMDPAKKSTEELCASFPKHMLEHIQPILKTGHGENKDKLDGQMDSSSACFQPDELLIFSDLDEKIRNHNAIDVLAYLPESHYNTTVFDLWGDYVAQKEMKANGTLDTEAQGKPISGWHLDKFKFLAMIERAWDMRPNKEFYVFYETDTYIFWDSMFRFLQTRDPDANLYMGYPSPGRRDPKRRDQGTLFANGGPGYVISRGAMKTLLNRTTTGDGQFTSPSLSAKFSYLNHDDECCGDSVLGWVLWEIGIPMQGYFPMFSPFHLAEIPYNDENWCRPIITMHRTSPQEMVELFKFEFGARQAQRPLVYSDIWSLRKPGTFLSRENWDGGRFADYEPPANPLVDSFQKCGQACKQDQTCLQWIWRGRDEKKCILLRDLQYGKPREPEKWDDNGVEKWSDFKSGWDQDRIKTWISSHECKTIKWIGASVDRR